MYPPLDDSEHTALHCLAFVFPWQIDCPKHISLCQGLSPSHLSLFFVLSKLNSAIWHHMLHVRRFHGNQIILPCQSVVKPSR